LYSQQGYEIKDANGTPKLDFYTTIKSLSFKKFLLEAGPQIGLAISKKGRVRVCLVVLRNTILIILIGV
jgi:hypothetical protein